MSNTGAHTDVYITMTKAEFAEMLATAVAAGIEKAGLASNMTNNKSSGGGTAESKREPSAHNLWRTHLESGSDAELSTWLLEHYPIGSDGKREGGQHWYMGIGEKAVKKHSDGKVTNCKLCQIGGHTVEIIIGADTLSKSAFPDKYAAFKEDATLLAKYRASKSGSAAPTTTTTTTAVASNSAASNSSASSDTSSTGSSKSSAGKDEGQKKKDIAYLKEKGVETTELAVLERATPAVVKARKQELQAQWHKEALKATADNLAKQKADTQARHDAAECHKIRTWHHQRFLAYEDMDLAALRTSQAAHKATGKSFKLVKKGEEAPPMAPAPAPASNSSASNSSASATVDMAAELKALAQQVVGPVYEREEVDEVMYLVEQGDGEGAGRTYEINEDGTRGAYVGELVMDAEGVLSIERPEGEGV